MSQPDRQVAVSGDAAAIERSWLEPARFAEVFDRHARHIHRYAARRVGPQVADDLVAETFLVAFERRRRYDLRRNDARPWLYGIATNLIGQHRRTEVRRLRVHDAGRTAGDGVSPCPADRVAADVTARSMRGPLVAVLTELPARERDVLLLIAWEELTYEEAAEALDIPVGTVRSRLSRVRQKLRSALGGANPVSVSEESP